MKNGDSIFLGDKFWRITVKILNLWSTMFIYITYLTDLQIYKGQLLFTYE